MYNEELKKRFISECANNQKSAEFYEATFKVIEPFENEWGADICTKNAQELQPAIDTIVGLRVRDKSRRLTMLKKYARWCIEMGVTGACDEIYKVDLSGVEKFKQQTVANPLQLQMYLNSICEPESEQTTDNIYRCFYWLAYAGADEEDIFKIKCSDVDLQNMIVKYKNTQLVIFREALPAFRNCVNLTSFAYKHPNYNKVIYKDRAPGDELIRGVRNTPSIKGMRVELSRRSKIKIEEGKTNLKLSYNRVWISGVFYRAYERECAGIPVVFLNDAARFMQGKTYKLDSGRNTEKAKLHQIARDYKKDYDKWKIAFHT